MISFLKFVFLPKDIAAVPEFFFGGVAFQKKITSSVSIWINYGQLVYLEKIAQAPTSKCS